MSTEIDRKINSRLRAFLLSQIEETKDNVRLAYVLGFRQKAGDTLNQQELEFLQEQEIEKRVLDKLEKIMDKVDHGIVKRRHGLLGEREAFAMIRFFYLVRIAQQGFLHLIANAYPTLESEAIIFLADKLVAGSMGGISTLHYEVTYTELIKNEAKNSARDIVFKLYNEVDEPVAEGFKTTYKEIMQIAHVIAGQGIYEHQKKEDGTYSTALFQPSMASVPAAYVVFPQLSMAASASASAAGPKLNVPPVAAAVENSTLPLPGFLLSSKTGPVTLPPPKDPKDDTANSAWTAPDAIVDEDHVDVESPAAPPVSENVPDQTPIDKEEDHHADEHDADSAPETDQQQAATTTTRDTDRTASRKKKSSKKKSAKSRRERYKRAESRAAAAAGQDATTHGEQFQDQEANDRANSIESNQQHEQEQEEEEEDEEEEEEEEDNEDDRFADADLSDDDQHEILQDDDDETDAATKDTTHTIKVQQDNATPSTPTTTTTTATAAPSPSQWQNFAAAFNNDTDGSNTPLSPKSRSGSSSRMERR